MNCARMPETGDRGQRFEVRGVLGEGATRREQALAFANTLATAERLAFALRRWPQCDPKSVRIVDRQATP